MSDRMNDQSMDPELLAAFLDGRLDATARERVLARIANSDDDLGVLADASSALANADSSEHSNHVMRATSSSVFRNRWMLVGLAAAALLMGVTLWRFTNATFASREKPAVVELISNLTLTVQPRSWSDDAWAVTRGSYSGGSERLRAGRIGALLVDVRVAQSTSDSSLTHLSTELERLLASYPAGSAAAAAARSLRATGNSESDKSSFTDVVMASAGLASPDQLNTGAALEAARLAAFGRDSHFFRNGDAIATVSTAAGHDTVAAHARAEFVRLQSEAAKGSVDWPGAATRLTNLLRTLVE